MSKPSDLDLLDDILICVEKIQSYINGITYEQFIDDLKTQDAVIRNIEVIGEAAKHLSDNLRLKYSDIPWKEIVGTRDRLIHGYFGVNIDIVWRIATVDIPKLKPRIEKMKNESVE